jgi:hypothetical protein
VEHGARLALVGGRVLGLDRTQIANVVIQGERIASVGQGPPPGDARVVDVAGLTVLPGLIELHTHPPTAPAMALFVRQGITSVRFAGTPLGAAAGLRGRVVSGELPGPRIFSCGPILDEAPAAWAETSIELDGPGAAPGVVAHVVDAEADALIVAQRMRPATLAAVVEAAHERGVPVTGQNWTTSVREAVEAGIDGIENTARLPEHPDRGPEWVEAYRSIGHRLARLVELWRAAPQGRIDEVVALMAERGVDWAPGHWPDWPATRNRLPRSRRRSTPSAPARRRAGPTPTATTPAPPSSGSSRRWPPITGSAATSPSGRTRTPEGCSITSSWIFTQGPG